MRPGEASLPDPLQARIRAWELFVVLMAPFLAVMREKGPFERAWLTEFRV